ncbi:metalloprotease [Halorientalis sp.]|uniref:metalloprotease n=1 Tax=Halorientalis sp. TaxID=1931229 RepID=UPI0032C24B6F
MNIRFSSRELLDLGAAWVALSVAFSILLIPGLRGISVPMATRTFGLSFLTVGVAFLLHELAHKIVAIRFGKIAEFRADYSMLFVAIMGAAVGFLFAAPGAVYHRGRSTLRQNGLIALAGPIMNLALAALFAPLAFFGDGFVGSIGGLGLSINLVLAAFNMVPFGPLDGNTVKEWNVPVFVVVFVPSLALGLWALFGFGLF